MNLDDFISETLVNIANGVSWANRKLAEEKPKPAAFILHPGGHSKTTNGIDFDVAVTTKASGDGRTGAKLKISVVEAEIGAGGGVSKESVSRVKFTVCVENGIT